MKKINFVFTALLTALAMVLGFTACPPDADVTGGIELPGSYSITFDANGGEFAEGKTQITVTSSTQRNVQAGDIPEPAHTNPDLVYIGYYTGVQDGVEVTTSTTLQPADENFTVYARYEAAGGIELPESYSITFDANGGEFAEGETQITVTNSTPRNVQTADIPEPAHADPDFVYIGYYTGVQDGVEVTTSTSLQLAEENFTVYARYENVRETINAYIAQVQQGFGDLSAVISNMTLPAGENGITVTWSSNTPANLSDTGVVTRPTSGPVTVTLTGTFAKSGVTIPHNFMVTISAIVDPNYQSVVQARDALQIETHLDYGYFQIPLPATGTEGTTITWASSNSLYTPVAYAANSGYRIKITDKNEFSGYITLTATISKGNASVTKDFSVRVIDKNFNAYLMVYFTGNSASEEQMRYALSTDGKIFTALNDNQPVKYFFNVSESGGIRDPFMVRGTDGRFYMCMTDMDADKGWQSNRGFVLMNSDDLINWNHNLVNIRNRYPNNYPYITRAWAPELIYDRSREQFLIYFAMDYHPSATLANPGNYPNKLYYTWVKNDWTDLEDVPQVLFDNQGTDVIDGSIYYLNDRYHMFYKHSGRVVYGNSSSLYGPYSNERTQIGENAQSEGPQTYRYIGSDTIVMFYDKDATQYFGYRETSNMSTWTTAANMTTRKADGTTFVARHGVVIPITQAEYNQLNTHTWPDPVPAVTEDATLKLHYTFESTDSLTTTGGIKNKAPGYAGVNDGTVVGTGGNRTITTTNGIRNFYTGTNNGNASGTPPAYINMGTGASSIVTAQADFTIATYVLVESESSYSGDGWFLWCMASTTGADETNGRYLFFKAINARQSFSVSGYGSESNISLGATLPKGRWQHVMYRQQGAIGVIFIDGKAAAYGNITIPSTSLPGSGNSGAIQYNWIGRPCFSGDYYMSRTRYADFRIYGGAISDSQIAALDIQATLDELNAPPTVANDATLMLHYTFSNVATTVDGTSVVADTTATIRNRAPGYVGQYNGSVQRTASTSSGLNSFTATGGTAVRNFYTGTSTGTGTGNSPAYIDMGTTAGSIITAQADYTVASYVYIDQGSDWSGAGRFLWSFAGAASVSNTSPCIWFRATDTQQTISLTGYSNENYVRTGTHLPRQRWVHVMYRQFGTQGTIYIDGAAVMTSTTAISTTQLGNLTYNWIGRPCYSGDNYVPQTRFADFRVYGGAISNSQIAALDIPAKVAAMNGN